MFDSYRIIGASDHVASGDFKPRIDRVFPFSQIVEAYRYMESNQQIGKIVVTP